MRVVTTGACMMTVVAVSVALLVRATLAWHSISSPTPTLVVPCPPHLRHFNDTFTYASEWRENDSETHTRREREIARQWGGGAGRRVDDAHALERRGLGRGRDLAGSVGVIDSDERGSQKHFSFPGGGAKT